MLPHMQSRYVGQDGAGHKERTGYGDEVGRGYGVGWDRTGAAFISKSCSGAEGGKCPGGWEASAISSLLRTCLRLLWTTSNWIWIKES